MADITLRKNLTNIVFIMLMVISLALMIFNFQILKKTVSATFDTISYPIVWVGTEVFNFFYGTYNSLSELENCEVELARHKEMLLASQYNLETIEALQMRIKVLEEQLVAKRLLDINKRYDWGDSIAAEIISFGSESYFETIIINKGSIDGIEVEMPVIAYQNARISVVGKVVGVSPYYSRIDPIYQPSCRIGAMGMESRVNFICEGLGTTDHKAVLKFIDNRADIVEGDIIVTAGEGSKFPKDILIGTVISIQENRMDRSKTAYIEPSIDFSRLEIVFVLKRLVDDEILNLLQSDSR